MLDRDNIRANLNRFTRRAFKIIPPIESPSILDIGCGTGVPTLELVGLSEGHIVAVDISREALDRLRYRAEQMGLLNKLEIEFLSAEELESLGRQFDIVWAEGVIAFLGFERGLREWRALVKPGGYIVIHDDYDNIVSKLELIPKCGYSVLDHFPVSRKIWWTDYYQPLESKIEQLETANLKPEQLEKIEVAREEIKKFKSMPDDNSSIFYIIQRIDNV